MTPHDPATLAILAVEFLGRDERRLAGLLDLAGLSTQEVKDAMAGGSTGFFGHVFSYLLSHEPWAEGFATEHNLSPEALATAARAFGAGGLMDG